MAGGLIVPGSATYPMTEPKASQPRKDDASGAEQERLHKSTVKGVNKGVQDYKKQRDNAAEE